MIKVIKKLSEKDYELIDSGEGEKLERFGQYVLRRPDPQALWKKNLDEKTWKSAGAVFTRDQDTARWQFKEGMVKEWQIKMSELNFIIKPTAFKHTGLFPEQEPNWQWAKDKIKNANRPIKVLNLFGYTGGATLACASVGAEVTHVDGSKSAINWGKENQKASGLTSAKIRWIEDDARKFVQREIKRGNKYEAIVMDPPAFGHGADNEVWKIEEDFVGLIDLCAQVLSDQPLFILINGYSAGYSAISYENNLLDFVKRFGGEIEKGELTIEENKSGRLLPAGIFARWSHK